ncbi:50S ribosomal protein L5 [Candidatus Vidania fulgoroideorum]
MSFNNKFIKVCNYFLLFKKYNIMEIPRINKIVLNMSLGYKALNKKYLNSCYEELKEISKQKPLILKAKKSISEFGIKKNFPISLKVTLRNKRIYCFLNDLLDSLSNIKDFEGFCISSFDYFGNYNFGIKDHTIFPIFFF